jgi:hypothetical protein
MYASKSCRFAVWSSLLSTGQALTPQARCGPVPTKFSTAVENPSQSSSPGGVDHMASTVTESNRTHGCRDMTPALAVLFAGKGSNSLRVTLAVLVMGPATVAVTTIVTVAPPPFAIPPRLQVTVPAACPHVPWLDETEPNVTLPGRTSVNVTPVAGPGPRLVNVTVYVRVLPTATGFGPPLFSTRRSAGGFTTTTIAPTLPPWTPLPP